MTVKVHASQYMFTCMFCTYTLYMYIYMYIQYIHVHVHVYLHVDIYMYMCMHVCPTQEGPIFLLPSCV